MSVKLILAPEVQQDLQEAFNWYEERRSGLGSEFLNCIDAGIQRIRRMPTAFPIVHQEYRRLLVRRFPYAIFFEHDGSQIIIYCIFHTSRDPQKWRLRLP